MKYYMLLTTKALAPVCILYNITSQQLIHDRIESRLSQISSCSGSNECFKWLSIHIRIFTVYYEF